MVRVVHRLVVRRGAHDLGLLARLARDLGAKAEATSGIDAIVERVVAEARPGDTVALFSNGAFGGIHDRLIAELERRRG